MCGLKLLHIYTDMICMGHLLVFGVVISAYLCMSMQFIIIKSYIIIHWAHVKKNNANSGYGLWISVAINVYGI